jgi:hypothetical protein
MSLALAACFLMLLVSDFNLQYEKKTAKPIIFQALTEEKGNMV